MQQSPAAADSPKLLGSARCLLNGTGEEELVPASGGITAGRLLNAIIRQQQRWSTALEG